MAGGGANSPCVERGAAETTHARGVADAAPLSPAMPMSPKPSEGEATKTSRWSGHSGNNAAALASAAGAFTIPAPGADSASSSGSGSSSPRSARSTENGGSARRAGSKSARSAVGQVTPTEGSSHQGLESGRSGGSARCGTGVAAEKASAELAGAPRCCVLSCVERLCEDLCARRPRRMPAQVFCLQWKLAMEKDGLGPASSEEVRVVAKIADLIVLGAPEKSRAGAGRSKKGRGGKAGLVQPPSSTPVPSSWRSLAGGNSAPAIAEDSVDTGNGERETGAATDRSGAAAAGAAAGPGAVPCRRGARLPSSTPADLDAVTWLHGVVRLLPQRAFFETVSKAIASAGPKAVGRLSEHLDLLAAMLDKPTACTPYRSLLTAVAVATGMEAGAVSSSSSANSPWISDTLSLLEGAAASGGLSCEAFVCATLGRRTSQVSLHLYNLSNRAERFVGRIVLGMDGVWHSGVAVHGFEYWYSGPVYRCRAARTPFGTPETSVPLGHTLCSHRELLVMVRTELLPRFAADSYDVLRLNCNDFCDALSLLLVGRHIPSTIREQADRAMESALLRWVQPMAKGWTSVQSVPGRGSQLTLPHSSVVGAEGAGGSSGNVATSMPSSTLGSRMAIQGSGMKILNASLHEKPKSQQDSHRSDGADSSHRQLAAAAALMARGPHSLVTAHALASEAVIRSSRDHAADPQLPEPPSEAEAEPSEDTTSSDDRGSDTSSSSESAASLAA